MGIEQRMKDIDARIAARKAALDKRLDQPECAAVRAEPTEAALSPEPAAPSAASRAESPPEAPVRKVGRLRAAIAKARYAPARGLFERLPSGKFSRRDILSVAVVVVAAAAALVFAIWFLKDPKEAIRFIKGNWAIVAASLSYVGIDLSLYVKRFLKRFNPNPGA